MLLPRPQYLIWGSRLQHYTGDIDQHPFGNQAVVPCWTRPLVLRADLAGGLPFRGWEATGDSAFCPAPEQDNSRKDPFRRQETAVAEATKICLIHLPHLKPMSHSRTVKLEALAKLQIMPKVFRNPLCEGRILPRTRQKVCVPPRRKRLKKRAEVAASASRYRRRGPRHGSNLKPRIASCNNEPPGVSTTTRQKIVWNCCNRTVWMVSVSASQV